MAQDRRRPRERQVRQDPERLARQRERGGITQHDLDVPPPPAQACGPERIELDGDDALRRTRELAG
jgi:hypothetical protein